MKKNSNENSLYNLIEQKENETENKELIQEIKNEIKNLQWLQDNISAFISILNEKRNFKFIDLNKDVILELHQKILIWLNANSKTLNKLAEANLELNYFFKILKSFTKKSNLLNLSLFELNILRWFDEFSDLEKAFYIYLYEKDTNIFKNWAKMFYKTLKSELFNIIQNIIDPLVEEYKNLNPDIKYTLSDLISENTKNNSENILEWIELKSENLIEIPYNNYSEYFQEIFDSLNNNKDENIVSVLYYRNLTNKLEDLFDYVSMNELEIKKQENWDLIYNFIIWISEDSFKKNFSDHIEKYKLNSIGLVSLTKHFSDIYENINKN